MKVKVDETLVNQEPLTLSVGAKGHVFLNDTAVALDDLVPKLKAITDVRGGMNERIFLRGDQHIDYGTVIKVAAHLAAAGFLRVALVAKVDQG